MMIQESGLIYKSRYFRKRRHILKTSACLIISAVAFTLLLILTAGAYGAHQVAGSVEMPVAQQNALVQKYCAVCHDDVHRNGGLSLQHFDASQLEPSLAAMMVSKLKSGAMGAAGLGVPDRPNARRILRCAVGEIRWCGQLELDSHAGSLNASWANNGKHGARDALKGPSTKPRTLSIEAHLPRRHS